MTHCTRCGQPFELRRPGDRRCVQCEQAVAQLIAADTARRGRIVWRPAVLTPFSGRRAW